VCTDADYNSSCCGMKNHISIDARGYTLCSVVVCDLLAMHCPQIMSVYDFADIPQSSSAVMHARLTFITSTVTGSYRQFDKWAASCTHIFPSRTGDRRRFASASEIRAAYSHPLPNRCFICHQLFFPPLLLKADCQLAVLDRTM
jgi:hypothetical protein